jgi:hypothetical protein
MVFCRNWLQAFVKKPILGPVGQSRLTPTQKGILMETSLDSSAPLLSPMEMAQAVAIEHAQAWLKAKPIKWKAEKFLLLIGLALVLTYYGKNNVVSAYYLFLEKIHWITVLWHLVATWLRHNIRGVVEGLYGGLVYVAVKFNALKYVAKWAVWSKRPLTLRLIARRLGFVLVLGIPGFVVALALIEANKHSASFHHIVMALLPGHYFHANVASVVGRDTWSRLASTAIGEVPQFILGFFTALSGRRAMNIVFWQLQHYKSALAVSRGKRDRWYHMSGYLGLKEYYRKLDELIPGASQTRAQLQPRLTLWFLRLCILVSVPGFFFGIYVITVIARKHAVS